MKVLMLGWELPPYNSGGLGVACEGLTEALSADGTTIYFTLPYEHPGDVSHMHVLSAYSRLQTLPSSNKLPPFEAYTPSRPLNGGMAPIASSLPGGKLLSEPFSGRDTPLDCLPAHDPDFDLCHIEPARMFGGIVELHVPHDPSGFSWTEPFLQ